MIQRILIFVFWSLFFQVEVSASFSNIIEPEKPSIFNPSGGCDAPPPVNPSYVERGSTWLKLQWQATSPLYQTHIKTYTVQGNLLVDDRVVGAGQSYTVINNMIPGTSYYSKLWHRCPDGTDGPTNSQTFPDFPIVSELVVGGFSGSSSSPTCTIDAPDEFCNFYASSTPTYFEVVKLSNGAVRQFYTAKNNENYRVTAHTTGSWTYRIFVSGQEELPNGDVLTGTIFEFTLLNGAHVATFELSEEHHLTGKLICKSITSDYVILRRGGGAMGKPPVEHSEINERDATTEDLSLSATPNPFTENLDIMLPAKVTQDTRVQILNLNGQVVLQETLPADQDQITFRTETLPEGIYIIRMEIEGKLYCLKLVKNN